MKTILKNARIIDPANGIDSAGAIAVNDGLIVAPSTIADDADTETVDLDGKVVCPGLIDMHVHLREPGQEYKEDIESGTQAAAAGGITTVLAMPNTIPPIDSPANVELLQGLIDDKAKVRVAISACLSNGRSGESAADIRALAATGLVRAFTDDGNCVPGRELMKEIMSVCAELGIIVVDHCEDRCVWNSGAMRESETSKLMGVQGQPPETESNIVERDIALCRETGCAVHIQHVSTTASVAMVRAAKEEGLAVSAEVTPHHLALTHRDVLVHGANAKMNPPLGNEADRQALIEALKDGTVDVLCTDHAPHAPSEKANGFAGASFGIIGLETAVPVSLTVLYHEGYLSLPKIIDKFTTGPARLLKLDAGTLSLGYPADVTVIDPDFEFSIDVHASRSKSRNSPFHGRRVKGRVLGTICAGNWVHRELQR